MSAIVALGGCGGAVHDSVAVRVGQVAITSAKVKRWTSVLAGGSLPSEASRRQALRAQALAVLISSQWALGEAAERGVKLSAQEVKRQFAQKTRASFPGGEAELHEFLKASGQSASDIAFEARAELASMKLRQLLASSEPTISQAQVASYYGRHRQRFTIPERRDVEMTNRKSQAEAQALKREVAAGKSFAGVAQREWVELSPQDYSASRGSDAALARAIHFARANVLSGPVLVHRVDYYVLEVKRITPARQRTLAQVRGSIRRQLAAEQQRRTLAAFIGAWRRKWTARTNCSPGYVVQKCRQYSGPRTPEDPVAFD